MLPYNNQRGVDEHLADNQHLFSELKMPFRWEAKRLGKFVKVEQEAELW